MGFRPFGQPFGQGGFGQPLGKPGGALTPAQLFDAYTATLAPLLWFKLNEPGGTTIINYGSLGAPQNGTWTPGAGALAQAGQLGGGQAALWDALATNLSVANSAAVDGVPAQTWCFLHKPSGTGENNAGRFFNYANSSGANASTTGGKGVTGNVASTSNAVSTSAVDFWVTGAWAWLFMTYDHAGDKKIHFYSGKAGAVTEATYGTQTAATGTQTVVTSTLYLGNRLATDVTYDGLFDEILFFNKVLSAAEMLQLTTLAGLT